MIKLKQNLQSIVLENIVLVFYGIALVSMCIFLQVPSPVINYMRYFYCLFIFAVVLFRKKKISINKVALFIVGCFLLHTLLFGFIFIPSSLHSGVIDNGKEMLMFWVFAFFTAQYVYETKKTKEFLLITYFVLSFFIDIVYFTHFNGIAPIKFLPNIFGIGDTVRVRFDFGFVSNNTAAYMCLMVFIFTVIVWREYLSNNHVFTRAWSIPKIYMFISGTITVLMMLSTQTRAALMLALGFWLVSKYFSNYANKRRKKSFTAFFLLIVVCIVAFYGYFVYTDGDSRSVYLTWNVSVFLQYGNLLTGLGYEPFSAFLNDSYGLMTAPMDNYYLYILCSTGYLGLILIIIPILLILFYFIYAYFQKRISKLQAQFIILFIVVIMMGFTESNIVYSFSPYSVLCWTCFLLVIMGIKKDKKQLQSYSVCYKHYEDRGVGIIEESK